MLLPPAALIALIAVLALAPAAWACGPHAVGLYDFGRFHYREAEGRSQGIDVDLVEALAKRSGCALTTTVQSRVRIWDQIARGQLALTASGLATPERERWAEFWPYFKSRNYALMRRELAAQYAAPEAFLADKSRHALVVKSYRHGTAMDALIERLRAEGRVHEVGDFDIGLRLLLVGRADMLLAQPLTLARRSGPGLDGYTLVDWAPRDVNHGSLVVSRSLVGAADRERLRAALQSLLRDGSIEAIFARHVGPELARASSIAAP